MNLDNRNREKSPALEEIENEEDTTTPDDNSEEEGQDEEESQEEEPEENEGEESTDEEDGEESEENEEEEESEEKPQKKQPVQKEESPSDKERLRESTKEAQLLHEQNKQLITAFEEVGKVGDPTEEDLKKYVASDGANWEDLSAFEKSMAKKNYVNEQKLTKVNQAFGTIKNTTEWADKVDGFLEQNETSQKDKRLIGKEKAFHDFAMKPTHRAIPFEVLVPAFLQGVPEQKHKTGSLFQTRSGGERIKPKSNKITDATEAERLRTTDPREYQRKLKAGLVEISIE